MVQRKPRCLGQHRLRDGNRSVRSICTATSEQHCGLATPAPTTLTAAPAQVHHMFPTEQVNRYLADVDGAVDGDLIMLFIGGNDVADAVRELAIDSTAATGIDGLLAGIALAPAARKRLNPPASTRSRGDGRARVR
jgi:hypothetical protein